MVTKILLQLLLLFRVFMADPVNKRRDDWYIVKYIFHIFYVFQRMDDGESFPNLNDAT